MTTRVDFFRLLRSSALHMLALGALLFGVVELRGGALFPRKPRLEIPAHRLEAVLRDFVADTARKPTPEEWRGIVDSQIDDEILFQYALTMGLQENSAAQTRLAQIAEFVEANPHEAPSQAAEARSAMDLGLHEGDLVVRRILTDSARRLIRSVVLLQQVKPEAARAAYEKDAREYERPARVRLALVTVNAFKWPDSQGRARELLARIRRDKLGLEQGLRLGDASPVPAEFALQTKQGYEAQLGTDFAAVVESLPPEAWSGPVRSRYGWHLVWVQQREDAYVPPFEQVRAQIEQRMLQKLADTWLKQRLQELRAEYEIVLPQGMDS